MICPFASLDVMEMSLWYEARGLKPIPPACLPETGFIAHGVAAGFLYRTDSAVALLEGYITNPRAGLRQRSRAIDVITAALLVEAKRRGAVQVFALCKARGIERRAQKFGMRTIGIYAMAALEV